MQLVITKLLTIKQEAQNKEKNEKEQKSQGSMDKPKQEKASGRTIPSIIVK